jgi:hypothetical protein
VDSIFEDQQSAELAIGKIAKIVCEWNAYRTYSKTNMNCQHFIEEICSALNLKLNFSGALADFISRLRSNGVADIAFPVSERLRTKLNITEKSKKFENHVQLDKFVSDIQKHDPTYLSENPHDNSLLKSFDRAFWLRHYKFPEDPMWMPEDSTSHSCSCPFKHPDVTQSIFHSV